MNVKLFCGHLNTQKFGSISNKCGANSATIQSVYTSDVALQTHAERYIRRFRIAKRRILAPFRKTQRWKRFVCKRNAYPLQDWGCNDMDPVQCKRSPSLEVLNQRMNICSFCSKTMIFSYVFSSMTRLAKASSRRAR